MLAKIFKDSHECHRKHFSFFFINHKAHWPSYLSAVRFQGYLNKFWHHIRGNVKKKSLFKDIIHIGGWVVKAFSKFF